MESRERIRQLVAQSSDETLGSGAFFHSKEYLETVGFNDTIDVLLYHISLQTDVDRITRIKPIDFWYDIVAPLWNKRHQRTAPSCEKLHEGVFSFVEGSPWSNGPGPMGGTAGTAESYLVYFPGFYHYNSLREFLLWPEKLADERDCSWPKYKKEIERRLFPKFRQEINQDKLAVILDFAEEVCQSLRTRQAKKAATV